MGYCSAEEFDGIYWKMCSKDPVIKPSENENDFDSAHVLDPETVVIDSKIYLYYTAYSAIGQGSIGLAIYKGCIGEW